jgi:hypothetical protein
MVKQTAHKAIVAAITGVLTLVGMVFGVDFLNEYGIGEGEIAAIGTVLTTLLVYMVPNHPKE